MAASSRLRTTHAAHPPRLHSIRLCRPLSPRGQVAHHLQKYLGQYVAGLDGDALRLKVLSGDVVLRDLSLRPEALEELRLPVRVTAGFVGSITLRVPWRELGKRPVEVRLDSILAVASLADEDQGKCTPSRAAQRRPEMHKAWCVVRGDPLLTNDAARDTLT